MFVTVSIIQGKLSRIMIRLTLEEAIEAAIEIVVRWPGLVDDDFENIIRQDQEYHVTISGHQHDVYIGVEE